MKVLNDHRRWERPVSMRGRSRAAHVVTLGGGHMHLQQGCQ